jgi:hypothetical protein
MVHGRYYCKVRYGTITVHYSSQIKIHKEVTKQQKSRFFLLFLLDDGRIRIQEAQNLQIGTLSETWEYVCFCYVAQNLT